MIQSGRTFWHYGRMAKGHGPRWNSLLVFWTCNIEHPRPYDGEIWRVVVDLAGIDQEQGKSEVGKGTAEVPRRGEERHLEILSSLFPAASSIDRTFLYFLSIFY